MVSFQKIVLSVLISASACYGTSTASAGTAFAGTPPAGTASVSSPSDFVAEPKQKKKAPLSKSRSEAAQKLEALAHSLTREITAATALLDEVMYAVRDCAENDGGSDIVKALQKDRRAALGQLEQQETKTRERVRELKDGMCAGISK